MSNFYLSDRIFPKHCVEKSNSFVKLPEKVVEISRMAPMPQRNNSCWRWKIISNEFNVNGQQNWPWRSIVVAKQHSSLDTFIKYISIVINKATAFNR